ncbi:MAG: hypothetical protein V7725_05125, partial [Porticoccus sp.]
TMVGIHTTKTTNINMITTGHNQKNQIQEAMSLIIALWIGTKIWIDTKIRWGRCWLIAEE